MPRRKKQVETEQPQEAQEAPERKRSKKSKSKSEKRSRSKKERKEKKARRSRKKRESKQESSTETEESPAQEETSAAQEETAPAESAAAQAPAKQQAGAEQAELSPLETLRQTLDQSFEDLLSQVTTLTHQLKNIQSELKAFKRQRAKERRETDKVIKNLEKRQRKKRRTGGNVGGFKQPVALSAPLCDFLGVANGTKMSRTDANRGIFDYIKNNNLQNPENKKNILPDQKLKRLLGCRDSDHVDYFNLQTYMKYHFLKTDKATGKVASYVPYAPPAQA